MNIRALLKSVGLALALTGFAQASDLTWTSQFVGSPLKFLYFSSSSSTSSYSNTFDITTDGFNPLTMTVDSAVASFAFADDSGDLSDSSSSQLEWVNISLGNPLQLFIGNQEVDGVHPYSSYAWYSDDLSVSLLADLQSDGKLAFKVQILDKVYGKYEDTYLKVAKLVAEGHVNNVPDESNTIILTGAAMLGLITLRKRLARRN